MVRLIWVEKEYEVEYKNKSYNIFITGDGSEMTTLRVEYYGKDVTENSSDVIEYFQENLESE